MKRCLFFMLSVLTVLATFAIIALWTQNAPIYQARSQVRVKPVIPHLVYETENNGMIPMYNSYLNTQVSIIKSTTVLQRVLDEKKVQDTNWYSNPHLSLLMKMTDKKLTPIERLIENLSVKPRRNTEIIDVTFTANEAQDSKVILNTILNKYLQYNSDNSSEAEDAIYLQLMEELRKLERKIQGTEMVIQERQKAIGTSSPGELVASMRLDIEEIKHQIAKVDQDISILKWESNRINELIKSEKGGENNNIKVNTSAQSGYFGDSEWRQLDLNVRTIGFQIESANLTENNPELIRLQERFQFAQDLLKLREAQIDEQRNDLPEYLLTSSSNGSTNYSEELKEIEYQIEKASHEKRLLTLSLDEQKKELDEIFMATQSLEKEISDLAHTRELYDTVRQRLDQKNMERNIPSPIEILSYAFVPTEYYNDNRMLYTFITLIVWFSISSLILIVSRIRSVKSKVNK